MKSPCIAICEMDEYTGQCLGCKRTLWEIMNWRSLSEEDREKIIQECKERD